MSQKSFLAGPEESATRLSVERAVRDIRRATRKHHSAEDKVRIVLQGLRGEDSIAALCRLR
jgi:transposase